MDPFLLVLLIKYAYNCSFQPPEVVITEDASREESASHLTVAKPPRPWLSLGSEDEILDEAIVQTRDPVSISISLLSCFNLKMFRSLHERREDKIWAAAQQKMYCLQKFV